VYRIRQKEYADWDSQIQTFPLCFFDPEKDARLFLQFNLNVNIDNELQKVIGWAHPDLIFLTGHGRCNVFLDCTFKVVPKGFSQLLIVMIFSKAHNYYVPVYYILLQSKKENAYMYALQSVISSSDWAFNASSVTCDFEQALMTAARCQFKKANFIGCYFHWKQAIKRKLTERALPKEIIRALIGTHGAMNILPLIPVEDIITKGIPYIRSKIDEGDHTENIQLFWNYFTNTWLKKYNPEMWNINHVPHGAEDDIIMNRTNCALERYNRTLQNCFPSPHPNMQVFVNTISLEARRVVLELENIKKGLSPLPVHAPVNIPDIPEDYECFTVPKLTKKKQKVTNMKHC
jgi:hypothetical protein